MFEGKSVAVVVPAYDEEVLLPQTLAGIPDFVDRVYVVDDASRDATAERASAAAAADPRIEVVVHERNRGVGAAIVSGYERAIADRIDVTSVMAADNQMDPADLEALVAPVARGEVDYAKANRLFTGQAWQLIPKHRDLGNAVLSLLTKIASGYWHVADSQAGYTALGLETPGLLLFVEGPDVLRGLAEGGVVRSHTREREDGAHRALHAALEEDVPDRHLQEVADLTLTEGAADVERHRMHDLARGLLLQQDPPDLGPVAVGDDDLPVGGRDVGHPLGGRARGAVHLLEGVLGALAQQRVAAERHHDPVHAVLHSLGAPSGPAATGRA